MADDLGIQHAFQHVDNIYTYDGSHLDRPNSEKWAEEFVKALDPAIEYCLAGGKREFQKPIDISKSITDGKTNFEVWKTIANTEVTNKNAIAPDGTQDADTIMMPKAGAKLQYIFRDQNIKKDSTVNFGIWLWSDDYSSIRLQLIRSCSAGTPIETISKTIYLTPRARRFELTKVFEHDHECTLVQIVSLKDKSNIVAWQGDFEYTEPEQP